MNARRRTAWGWMRFAAAWLLTGAALTTAIAWASEVAYPPQVLGDPPWYRLGGTGWAWAPTSDRSAARTDSTGDAMPDCSHSRWNQTLWWATTELLWRNDEPVTSERADDPGRGIVVGRMSGTVRCIVEEKVGVPFHCFGEWAVDENWKAPAPMLVRHGRWQVTSPTGSDIHLSLIPLWPGFALNTIFYAALAWGLWQVPLALRRRSRRRNGLCTHCAYDRTGIATDAPCPECGRAP